MQGTGTAGPLTLRGTYSWTKSRVLGVTPAFQALFPSSRYPQYQPGATFQYLAEHTWAGGVTYARAGATISLNATGLGRVNTNYDRFKLLYLSARRLPSDAYRAQTNWYVNSNAGYAMADLNMTQRLTSRGELVLQVNNLADRYVNDFDATYASIGRQTSLGLRWRY
jgi:hypothetical protein